MDDDRTDLPDFDVSSSTFAVLAICTGNICRSPMTEVVLRAMSERTETRDGLRLASVVTVASAGTANWHAGSAMDDRARAALDRRGYEAAGSPAVHMTRAMLSASDLVLALDRGHRAEVRRIAPDGVDVRLLGSWRTGAGPLEVADPFYGDDEAFDRCLDQIEDACSGLVGALAVTLR